MDSSSPSLIPGWDDPPKKYTLDPEAKQALGKVSPELAWRQVQDKVVHLLEEDYREAVQELEAADYPVDLRSLVEVLAVGNPVRAVNNLHYANPNLNLQNLEKQNPLKVLRAVLKMLTSSDRWAAMKP
jgi:hypothetical protein